MNFVDFVRLLGRHVVLAALVLLVALKVGFSSGFAVHGTHVQSQAKPSYESTAVVALLPQLPAEIASGAVPIVDPKTGRSNVASDVVRSADLWPAALSIQAVIEAPSFVSRISSQLPGWKGTLSVKVPQQTNILRITSSAPTRVSAVRAMKPILAEVQAVAARYTQNAAVRFPLQANIVDEPSTATAVSTIASPMRAVVLTVVILLVGWLVIRGLDQLQAARREEKKAGDRRSRMSAVFARATDIRAAMKTAVTRPAPAHAQPAREPAPSSWLRAPDIDLNGHPEPAAAAVSARRSSDGDGLRWP
jgi:hypothetical protein